MKDRLIVIKPPCGNAERAARMEEVLAYALSNYSYTKIENAEQLDGTDTKNCAVLFAVCLTKQGLNIEYYRMLEKIRTNRLAGRFAGSAGGILVDGAGELYTKTLARELVFAANRAGMAFPGKALVEGTGSLYNYETISMLLQTDNLEAYKHQARALVEKILSFQMPEPESRNILVVHAGNRKTSNSLMIWDKVKSRLQPGGEDLQTDASLQGPSLQGPENETKEHPDGIAIREIALQNGQIFDCRGCPYETCLHFGENGQCFYGGVMVEQVYPALLEADTVILICPNYNDAVSANIMAFINRLTALFRTNDFSQKRFYAVIVSGYSGGDLVAQQVIGAMNFNKNMILPPDFALIETANTPGSILDLAGIGLRAESFAERILGKQVSAD